MCHNLFESAWMPRNVSETVLPVTQHWRESFWQPGTNGVTPAESSDEQSENLCTHQYSWVKNRVLVPSDLYFSLSTRMKMPTWQCHLLSPTQKGNLVQGIHMACPFAVICHCGPFFNLPDAPSWPVPRVNVKILIYLR